MAKPAFWGREDELRALQSAYASDKGAFVPVYGRRRVGKSRLIDEFVRDKPVICFVGKRAPAAIQIKEFMERAADSLGEPLLAEVVPETWRKALETVWKRWQSDRRLILVLDEFQWIAENSEDITSTLQEIWDKQWQHDRRIMLILCGSYVGFMEREVLGSKSPLFGRRTAQILLRPFGFQEAAAFHSSYSVYDRARTYFICGGIPLYLGFFDKSRSVEENIARNLLDQFSPMFYEPDFLLREELKEVELYHAVLMALAEGRTTSSTIAQFSGVNERVLHYYLGMLQEIGYVKRRVPLTGEKPNQRTVRFILADPLLKFWFRFVFPHQSLLRSGGSPAPLLALICKDLDAYFGRCFELLCQEALSLKYATQGTSPRYEVGEYWDKSVQIDVVGIQNKNWIDIGECKWGESGSPKAWAEELARRAEAFPNPRNASLNRILFTRNRIARAKAPKDTTCYSLADLYEFGRKK